MINLLNHIQIYPTKNKEEANNALKEKYDTFATKFGDLDITGYHNLMRKVIHFHLDTALNYKKIFNKNWKANPKKVLRPSQILDYDHKTNNKTNSKFDRNSMTINIGIKSMDNQFNNFLTPKSDTAQKSPQTGSPYDPKSWINNKEVRASSKKLLTQLGFASKNEDNKEEIVNLNDNIINYSAFINDLLQKEFNKKKENNKINLVNIIEIIDEYNWNIYGFDDYDETEKETKYNWWFNYCVKNKKSIEEFDFNDYKIIMHSLWLQCYIENEIKSKMIKYKNKFSKKEYCEFVGEINFGLEKSFHDINKNVVELSFDQSNKEKVDNFIVDNEGVFKCLTFLGLYNMTEFRWRNEFHNYDTRKCNYLIKEEFTELFVDVLGMNTYI